MARLYGWIIEKDYDAEAGAQAPSWQNAKGLIGPDGVRSDIVVRLLTGEGERFKMMGDGETIYEGRILDLRGADYKVPLDESPCFGFEPLDDFGRPNWGCDEIHYVNPKTGRFEQI